MSNVVQIGACGGKDRVMSLLSKPIPNTKIHLIEPLRHNFIRLQENYQSILAFNDVIFYNCAISTHTGKLQLYYQKELKNNPDNLDEHCSFSFDHLMVHGHQGNIDSFTIDCYTLNDFVQNNKIESIAHLYLDTEGHDCDILLSTQFDKISVDAITFETVHSDGPFKSGPKLEKTLAYLNNNGYTIKNSSGFDITVFR